MIKIAVCDEKNEAAVLTEKMNEIFEKDETMIRMSYFKNASLLRYEVEDRVYFDLYILVIQQGQTEKEKQLMKTVRERDSEAFFLVLADKLEPTLAFPIKSVQIIKKNATDDEIENIIEDIKAAMEKRKKQCYIMKNQAGTWRILYKDIQIITHEGKYSIFLVQGERKIRVRKTLKEIFEELTNYDFIWIDRGTICNLAFVECVNNGAIIMKNGDKFWISRGKIKYFKQLIQKYWGESAFGEQIAQTCVGDAVAHQDEYVTALQASIKLIVLILSITILGW